MFIKPVGLALGTYLIAQDENIMYMIDIHAANERINYERYMKAIEAIKQIGEDREKLSFGITGISVFLMAGSVMFL